VDGALFSRPFFFLSFSPKLSNSRRRIIKILSQTRTIAWMGNCICPSEGVRINDTQLQLASTIVEYDCKAWRVIHWCLVLDAAAVGKGKLQFWFVEHRLYHERFRQISVELS
jgi:hypothetical protein